MVGGVFFVAETLNGNKTAWKKVEDASLNRAFIEASRCESKENSEKLFEEPGDNPSLKHSL